MNEKNAEATKQEAPVPRKWVKPVFQRLPLEKALSDIEGAWGDGVENFYYLPFTS